MTAAPTLRRARPDESGRLSEIAQASKRHWGYPQAWLDEWRDGLTVAPEFVASHPVTVAVDGDRPVAFYALVGSGPSVWLEHLWVEPSWIGRGLGRALVDHAVQTARDWGAAALWIDSDPHAEAFYLRMGARRVGQTRADVGGERRDLPRLRLDLRA